MFTEGADLASKIIYYICHIYSIHKDGFISVTASVANGSFTLGCLPNSALGFGRPKAVERWLVGNVLASDWLGTSIDTDLGRLRL